MVCEKADWHPALHRSAQVPILRLASTRCVAGGVRGRGMALSTAQMRFLMLGFAF